MKVVLDRDVFQSVSTYENLLMRKIKTEHNGAKNGGGYWGKRAEAKQISKKLRRADDKMNITRTSESSLGKDWLRPEEDEVWQNL